MVQSSLSTDCFFPGTVGLVACYPQKSDVRKASVILKSKASIESLYTSFRNIKFRRETIIRLHPLLQVAHCRATDFGRSDNQARSTHTNVAITWSHSFRQSGSFTFIIDWKARLDARSMARIFLSTKELATNDVVTVRVHNDCNDVTNRSALLLKTIMA